MKFKRSCEPDFDVSFSIALEHLTFRDLHIFGQLPCLLYFVKSVTSSVSSLSDHQKANAR